MKLVRLAVLPTVALTALALASMASAAYTPMLIVSHSSYALSAPSTTTISVTAGQSEADDASARISLHAPPGYQSTLNQPPGTRIGSAQAQLLLRGVANARVPAGGTVVTDDPAKAQYVSNQCAPGVHQAVWLLTISVAGQSISVPLYVDQVTAGPEAAFTSTKIVVCFASPYEGVPNRSASGAQLLNANLALTGVFTNPSSRGSHRWTGLFTPYVVNTATPNLPGTVQAQGIVRVPIQLSLVGQYFRRGRFARTLALGGNLTAGGAVVRGARVRIFVSSTRRVRLSGPLDTARTDARGRYVTAFRLRRGVRIRVFYFRAATTVANTNVTAGGCQPAVVAQCVNVWTAGFTLQSRTIRVRVR
jgi:hypothetical protein